MLNGNLDHNHMETVQEYRHTEACTFISPSTLHLIEKPYNVYVQNHILSMEYDKLQSIVKKRQGKKSKGTKTRKTKQKEIKRNEIYGKIRNDRRDGAT